MIEDILGYGFNDLTGIVAVIGIFLVPIALFWVIYKIIKVCNERKVNTVLAEQGIMPATDTKEANKGTALMWACSLVGLGAGLAIASAIANQMLGCAIVIILLGAGMLCGYFLKSKCLKG